MACFSAKFAFGAALAAMVASLGGVVVAAPTGPGEAIAIAALLASMAGYIAAALALAECLEANGRREDGEALRRDVDDLRREMDRIRQVTGVQ